MPKHLRDIIEKDLSGVKKSKIVPMELPDDIQPAKGGKEFTAKHKIEKHEDRVGNGSGVYTSTLQHAVDINHKHGYAKGEDEKVYEERGPSRDFTSTKKVKGVTYGELESGDKTRLYGSELAKRGMDKIKARRDYRLNGAYGELKKNQYSKKC